MFIEHYFCRKYGGEIVNIGGYFFPLKANQNRDKRPWIVSLAHKVSCCL